ncbi:HAD hydrolase-like protein [Postechiella marina]|uniref:HAD hydrolase-like protein n=1 Tax=Postechiella marina TaxID=943941 RepID=A0ABP8C1H4_9FLAO
MDKKIVFVFDLDDTLYNEIDYLKSAYRAIASLIASKTKLKAEAIFDSMILAYHSNENPFEKVITETKVEDVTIADLLALYRNHTPDITLTASHKKLLNDLRKIVFKMGLITDGRSVQQRNKLKALGLDDYFDDIIISEEFGSEKPNINNFKYYENKYGKDHIYAYVGDNTTKDFIGPNALGWCTICVVNNGKNIHKQSFKVSKEASPRHIIKKLPEVLLVLQDVTKIKHNN